MNNDLEKNIENFIRSYINKLKVLISIFPTECRIIFPEYFYKSYQIVIHLCSNGIGIQFKRKINKTSIKFKRKIEENIENVIFPVNLDNGYFKIKGQNISVENFVILTKSFSEKYPSKIPKNKTKIIISDDMGPIKIYQNASVKIRNFWYLNNRKKRYKELFIWIFGANNFNFSEEEAIKQALNDFYHYIFIAITNFFKTPIKDKTTEALIRAMKHVNNRFYNEIIRTNNIELDMLKFFKDYKFILAPLAKRIDPEFSLDRKYFIDFVTFDNDDVKLIELESPNENIFINNRKSKIFIDSINQVKDWFDWIEENSNRANDLFDQNLPRTAFIIIGKKEFHNQVEIQNIQNFNLKENKIELFTYDDLHFQFSLFIKRMEEQLKIEDTSSTI